MTKTITPDELCDWLEKLKLYALESAHNEFGHPIPNAIKMFDEAISFIRTHSRWGWHDISSAPKDGSLFDSWAGNQRIPNTYWSQEENGFRESPYGTWYFDEPTHWTPIQAQPEQEES